MAELLATLDLERLEVNLFRGLSPQVGWQRVFGGQVIAQALIAAQRTVEAPFSVHSLHAYFILAGDPSVPIIYGVERIRDGKSFATRRVVATQHGRAIFALSASFQVPEAGLSHQVVMPDDIPAPETLMSEKELIDSFIDHVPAPVKRYWSRERALEMRPLSLTHFVSSAKLDPVQRIWMRAKGDAPKEPGLQAALLAYFSDMTLLDASLYAHGRSIFDPSLQVASLDHAMWFHAPVDTSQWLLYDQDSPWTGASRGLSRGCIFDRTGCLIASVAQEGLIRMRREIA
ncbi:MAG: acyl-CoA thioesterase II [Rhizobiaceae bacterium]|nr:acyl-CoA thioesterase II [Rhizobiaceae bacterium]